LGYVTTVKAWDDPTQHATYFLDDVS
jgi:hypothetical protein